MEILLNGSARKMLAIEPEKLYPEMFKAIEEKNWSKFGKALDLLSDLIKEIDETLESRLHLILTTAKDQRNAKIARRNVQRLIISSANVLLKSVLENTEVDKKEYSKQAFKELETLKGVHSEYAEKDFAEDFSDALDNLTKPSVFNKIIENIITKINTLQ